MGALLARVLILAFILASPASATRAGLEIVPPERRMLWQPGIPGGIPEVPVAANARELGARGAGQADDAPAIQRAIDAVTDSGAVVIPAGTYLLRSPLVIRRSVVLRGEGVGRTHLIVDHNMGPAILITGGAEAPYVSLTGGYRRGSTTLIVADTSPFRPGSLVEIQQDNAPMTMYTRPEWNQPWARGAVGQIVRVSAVSDDTLTIDEPLRLDYHLSFNPRVRPVRAVERAGVERLRITRRDRSETDMIVLRYSAFSWVREIESEYAYRRHVMASGSYRCEIRDSYFHRAGDYGDGGRGYGVTLNDRTSHCLVENNIFNHLRHAMLIQLGATGNVFGYNYSRENVQNQGEPLADLSLHGHYPNFNLYEGNVVQDVRNADYWGPSGPGNTFFRNRVETTLGTRERRGWGPTTPGIWINDHSHRQNVVGNEIVSGEISVEPTVRDTLVHGNRVRGAVSWDPAIPDRVLPASYYVTTKPPFYAAMDWPSTGADRPNGTNPAKQRYLSRNSVPQR